MEKTLEQLKNRKVPANKTMDFVKEQLDKAYDEQLSKIDVVSILDMVKQDCFGNNKTPTYVELIEIIRQCYKMYMRYK